MARAVDNAVAMFRRYLPRIALAAAAAASIATSQLSWFLDQMAPIAPIALEDGASTRMFAIQATVETGELDPDGLGGDLQVSLELTARPLGGAVAPARVEVELRSAAREGEVDTQIFTLGAGERLTEQVRLPAWHGCPPRSCTEDFTLTLRRLPISGVPIVDVVGSVHTQVLATGGGQSPPPGTAIVLDITDLGPVP